MKRWPLKSLEEVCRFSNGLWKGEKPPFRNVGVIRNTNFTKDGSLDDSDIAYLEVEERKFEKRRLQAGDIILEKSGGSPKQPVGRVALFEKKEGDFSFSNFTAAIRVVDSSELAPRFLHKFLHWIYVSGVTERMQTNSTGIRNLNTDTYKTLELPVPPLAEQERIVKLLDEADALRKLRAQADRRTAALLPALFDELFGRHLTTPPVLVSIDGATAPKGWRWVRLTEVARLATGHTPSRRKPEYWTGGTTPWITLTDIRKLDGTVAETTSEFVTEAGLENSSAVKLPKGTVCFSRTASVGFVTVMGREMCTSQDFVNWVCGPELDPIYLMAALMQARDHLRALASGSTHKTIYFPTVEQFSIPIPPLPLQQTFARRVGEIRELEAAQAASRRRLDALFASLLHRAFAGELVQQDPAKETAEPLLTRIQARSHPTLPTGDRKIHRPEDYFIFLVFAALHVEGGRITLARMVRIVSLLADKEAAAGHFKTIDTSLARTWLAGFNQPLPVERFKAVFRLMRERDMVDFRLDGDAPTLFARLGEKMPRDPWVDFDATLALRVVHELPTLTLPEARTRWEEETITAFPLSA